MAASVTNDNQPQSKKRVFEYGVSVRTAMAIVIVVAIAAAIVLAIPRLQEPPRQLEILSKNNWWTKDGIGGDTVLHVNVTVENNGPNTEVGILNVKVEESSGRSYFRFVFLSISPRETVEEMLDFPQVQDEEVKTTAWLTYP